MMKRGRGRILYGTIGEERDGFPGVYDFTSTDGIVKTQVICLTPDASRDGFGEFTKPHPGTPCIVIESDDGGQGFAVGFHAMPKFDDENEDTPQFEVPAENFTAGDKVLRTKGGARLIMKRGGLASLEGGPGAVVQLNPTNNLVTINGSNNAVSMDGYKAVRGRRNVGTTEVATRHEEKFDSAVGPSFDRVRETRGKVGSGDARREVTVESVTVAGGRESALASFRETVNADGSWESKGPSYAWGGGDEAMVLGNQLVDAIGQLIDIIKTLQHTTAVGPTSPPLPPFIAQLDQLKLQLSDMILSTFMKLSKNPEAP